MSSTTNYLFISKSRSHSDFVKRELLYYYFLPLLPCPHVLNVILHPPPTPHCQSQNQTDIKLSYTPTTKENKISTLCQLTRQKEFCNSGPQRKLNFYMRGRIEYKQLEQIIVEKFRVFTCFFGKQSAVLKTHNDSVRNRPHCSKNLATHLRAFWRKALWILTLVVLFFIGLPFRDKIPFEPEFMGPRGPLDYQMGSKHQRRRAV